MTRAGLGIASTSLILIFHSAIPSSVLDTPNQSVGWSYPDIEQFKEEMEKSKAHNNTLSFNITKADSQAEAGKTEEKKTE